MAIENIAAIGDIEPERSFVLYAGQERYRLGDATEAIGLAELCEAVKGQTPGPST